MELEYRKLTDDELSAGLAELSNWTVDGGRLRREFTFPRYMLGLEFVTRVASLAEEMDHHPDIELGYKRAVVQVDTHSVGGLSPYDLELARRIDRLA